MALEGIINEQEFFSQHYLDENLQQEIAPWAKEQEDKEKEARSAFEKSAAANAGQKADYLRTPWAQLSSSAGRILKRMQEAVEIADASVRVKAVEEITKELCGIFELPNGNKEDISADGVPVPLYAKKSHAGGVYLWIFSSIPNGLGDEDSDDSEDPLLNKALPEQFVNSSEAELKEFKEHAQDTWQEILSKRVFGLPNSPRWVILAGVDQWILIDKFKFSDRRILRFNWTEILSRKSPAVLKTTSFLLGQEAFQEDNGSSRLLKLEDLSFRHAQGVSNDLKYALREAVELLGNEAASQIRQQAQDRKKGFYSAMDAAQLSAECLRYLYRLLFIFFIESRRDLQYAPMIDEHYVSGYSLEFLRDLELVPLTTDRDLNGRYLHDSIQTLFDFFSRGTPEPEESLLNDRGAVIPFGISPVPSSLFDDSKMPLLKNVVFTNKTLQRVIELMSLSRPKSGGGKKTYSRRGRISYAHLGLNQLGAVYETLLSFSGFFAKEDLYEVKKKEEKSYDVLSPAYFVGASEIEQYSEEERVFDRDEKGNRKLRVYPKGTFIYRMSGSERENSASYYTPEVLTKALVKYSLQELEEQQLKGLETDAEKAERILKWRICEPAMGSAAFLNEGANQVAELYMRYAMRVPGAKSLSQSEYATELQKVKMFIADKNIYGVDLNPVAVELAEVSIWLNAVTKDHHIPWFGLQLHCGNSLVGCRRNAYKVSDLTDKKIGLRKAKIYNFDKKPLESGYVWQFLLPHPSMSSYKDPTIESLVGGKIRTLKKRVKEFNAWRVEDLRVLEALSLQVEALWMKWASSLKSFEEKTQDAYSIYGHEEAKKINLPYAEKEAILKEAKYGTGSLESGEFARIKTVLDYWCALWGWPIEEAEKFPTWTSWLEDIKTLLLPDKTAQAQENYKTDLFEELNPEALEAQKILDPAKRREVLGAVLPSFGVADRVSEEQRFLHWPLRFAQVFLTGGQAERGFDLTLGNPPWMVVSWNAAGVLGGMDPKFVVYEEEYSSKGIDDVIRGKRDKNPDGSGYLDTRETTKKQLIKAFESVSLSNTFFNTAEIYPGVEGSQKNLFKLFLPTVWRNSSKYGVQGILHPETPYTETRAAVLRSEIYHRLKRHYHFENVFRLFSDIDSRNEFSINIYGKESEEINFKTINSLFIPETIERIQTSGGKGEAILSRKNDAGGWETRGHPFREILIDDEALKATGEIFGDESYAPKLPYFFSRQALEVAKKYDPKTRVEGRKELKRLASEQGKFLISPMWHESEGKKGGIFKELPGNATVFPDAQWKAILNGPHLSVGNPLFKTPKNPCTSNGAWDLIDLSGISDEYMPRVKYLPVEEDEKKYRDLIPSVPWDSNRKFVDFYRLGYREMVNKANERTLSPSIIPPQVAHVNNINSIAFLSREKLCLVGASFVSLPIDYFVRLQNKAHMLPQLIQNLPLPTFSESQAKSAVIRVLALNCLTTAYSSLWEESWDDAFSEETWSSTNPGIKQDFFKNLSSQWQRSYALRSDLMRRQALLELDVLVAQAFGFTLDELLFMYKTGFDVMRKYDRGTYYDRNGRIIFAPNAGSLSGIGLPMKAKADEEISYAKNGNVCEKGIGFEDVKDMESGKVSKTYLDKALSDAPKKITIEYQAPFFSMNREEDYRQAWEFFEKKEKKN